MTDSQQAPFDLVVLGAGSGGYAAALRAAELGLTVALIEKGEIGGTCLHWGCIPTKALLHSGEVADSTRTAGSVGVAATFHHIDMAAVHAYSGSVVGRLYKGLQGLIKARGIDVFAGEGRLSGPTTVVVGDRTVEGRHILVATGSAPRSIPGVDVDGVRVITSDHALRLAEVPGKAVILGGGVIGVEFASAWRSFGAEVTIVEALPHLVPSEEESSSKLLERAYRRRGIKLELGTSATSVVAKDDSVTLTLSNGTELAADVLLVAVGRRPVTDYIGLDVVGVETDRGFVKVDSLYRTSVPTVSAVGDLIPNPAACARRVRGGNRRGRASRRAQPHPGRLRRRSARDLLAARRRLGRSYRE